MRLLPHRTFTDERSHSTKWALWRWFDIWKDGQIYLTRLTLFRCPLFQIMIHWIKQPDSDRGVHDHPWWFFCFVLRGEYMEVVGEPGRKKLWLNGVHTRLIRFFNFKSSNTAHKITRLSKGGVVTLVVTGAKSKSWGFYEEDPTRSRLPGGCIPVTYSNWKSYLGAEA